MLSTKRSLLDSENGYDSDADEQFNQHGGVLDLLNECQRIRQNRFHYLQENFFEHQQELKQLLDPNTGRIPAQLAWDRKELRIDLKPIDRGDDMNARLQEERYRQSQKRQAESSQDYKEPYLKGMNGPVQSTYVSDSDNEDSYKQNSRAGYKYNKLLQTQKADELKRINSSATKTDSPEPIDENSNEKKTNFKSFLDSRDMQIQDEGIGQRNPRINGVKYTFGWKNSDKLSVERPLRNKLYNRASNVKGRQFLKNPRFSKIKKLQHHKNALVHDRMGRNQTDFLDSDDTEGSYISDSDSSVSRSASSSTSSGVSSSEEDTEERKKQNIEKKRLKKNRKHKDRTRGKARVATKFMNMNNSSGILKRNNQEKKATSYRELLRKRRGSPRTREHKSAEGVYMYKQCALVPEDSGDIRMVSIYDGMTTYYLNEWKVVDPERENHKGFYAYSMKEEALQAVFPRNSRLKDSPRVLLKIFVPHDSVEHVDQDIYVCTRLKPKKVWDICIDNGDDQKQFRASSSTAHADNYDHMGACRVTQKWKIVEWNHGGIWK